MLTIEKKISEHQMTSNDILDRFVDGKIIDNWEMYDRVVMFQQLGLLFGVPRKNSPKRIR